MTDFNLETACREAQNRLHRSIGQLARQAKVRALRNCGVEPEPTFSVDSILHPPYTPLRPVPMPGWWVSVNDLHSNAIDSRTLKAIYDGARWFAITSWGVVAAYGIWKLLLI